MCIKSCHIVLARRVKDIQCRPGFPAPRIPVLSVESSQHKSCPCCGIDWSSFAFLPWLLVLQITYLRAFGHHMVYMVGGDGKCTQSTHSRHSGRSPPSRYSMHAIAYRLATWRSYGAGIRRPGRPQLQRRRQRARATAGGMLGMHGAAASRPACSKHFIWHQQGIFLPLHAHVLRFALSACMPRYIDLVYLVCGFQIWV